ncbi:MAG TPA: ABC transporter substrate-binding protein [Chloroflexota bacterium]|nr:ABC transporter substrate-binding protein [Chloroflexota bacterium]
MTGFPAPCRVMMVLLALGLGAACRAPAAEPPRAGAPPPAAPAGGASASAAPAPAALQKIDVCTPGVSQGFSGVAIAQQAGYFAELGLDVNIQPIQGVVCTQALSSNTVQFSGSPSTLDVIIQGVPYRILYVSQGQLGHQMAVAAHVNGWADLRGGRIAVSALGSPLSEGLARDILRDEGVNPDEAQFVALGLPSNRLAGVLSGSVDAALLSAQEVPMALNQGLKTLPYKPRVSLGSPMTATLELAQSNPDLVQRFVKGVLMGHLLYAQRKDEALPVVARWTEAPDPAYEEQVYAIMRPTWTPDGMLSDEQQRGVIAATREAVKATQEFAPDEVFDFRFARQAYQELQAANWHGLWPK